MRQGHAKSRAIPSIWLLTDERVGEAAILHAARRLPRGAAIILRHYATAEVERRLLFRRIRSITQRRGLVLLLAGDPAMARAWGAQGHHGRASASRGQGWLHSAPVHDRRELDLAVRAGADVVLLSPLFPTRSHPGAAALGPARFAALARLSPLPVIALGGIHPRHANLVRRLGAQGYAAIDGLVKAGKNAERCEPAPIE